MNDKITIVWIISLLVIAITTVIGAVFSIISVSLPDTAIRIMGICDLCAIPVFVFTSVRRGKK